MGKDSQKVGLWQGYRLFWKNYFNFRKNTNSSRSEYWWPALVNIIIIYILSVISLPLIFSGYFSHQSSLIIPGIIVAAIGVIYAILMIIPNISITYRRYHDVGISGWWLLLTIALPEILGLIQLSFLIKAKLHGNPLPWISVITWIISVINIIICAWRGKNDSKFNNDQIEFSNDSQKVGILTAYGHFWKNYFNFKKFSSRSEYWWVFLINAIVWVALMMVSSFSLVNLISSIDGDGKVGTKGVGMAGIALLAVLFGLLYRLVILIPSIAITYRRYRDAGISAWWMLLTIALPIVLIIIMKGSFDSVILTVIAGACYVLNLIFNLLPTKDRAMNKYKK